METQQKPLSRDNAFLKVSHSPTSSTSSGPNTPTNENPNSEQTHKFPTDAQNCLDLLRETEVVRAPKQRGLPPEVLDFLASSREPEEPALLQTYKALETRPQRSSVEPIVKLKIRYVARDLWQTISFPTNITVAQARDVCLLRCNLWLESKEGGDRPQISDLDDGIAVTDSISSEIVPSRPKKRNSITGLAGDGKPEFALFWNAAGHWLDDFRRLDSYALRPLDILELQVRSEFIFIQPTLYNEHYAEGHLYKLRGGLTPSWKMRWFVLQGRTIWHFRRRKEATPSGSADLSRPFQVQETSAGIPGSTDGKETCLVLKFSQKCWWLRALSPEDLDHWRRILITLHREVSDHCAVHYSAKPPNEDGVEAKPTRQGSQHSEDTDSGSGVSGGMRIKAGYMHRRTPITHAFRERYFVLRGKELSCYKSDRFDKKNNTARVIALHTVEVTAYEADGRYYIRIVDKQAGQEDVGFVTDPNRKKKDIRSILSSTKSLPARAASWIGKSGGSQLDTEYLYVDNREDWEAWRSALESIAMVDIILTSPEDMKIKAAPVKSSSKSVATHLSSSTSIWSRFSNKKSIFGSRSQVSKASVSSQPEGSSRIRMAGSRFSSFIKARTTTPGLTGISAANLPPELSRINDTFSSTTKYDDIDERDEMTDLEISLKTSQFDMDFPSPPPFTHPQIIQATEHLSPLDRLLAEDAGDKDFKGPHSNHVYSGNSRDREALSVHSGIPSVDMAFKGTTSASSHKFTWFKKKP